MHQAEDATDLGIRSTAIRPYLYTAPPADDLHSRARLYRIWVTGTCATSAVSRTGPKAAARSRRSECHDTCVPASATIRAGEIPVWCRRSRKAGWGQTR